MTEFHSILMIIVVLPLSECAGPSSFFWRPRLAIDLTSRKDIHRNWNATRNKIYNGRVVLIDGYKTSVTMLSLASGFASRNTSPYHNPGSASYYTNIYRWSLRYLSFIPHWLGNSEMSYPDTHKVWRRRFYYMDEFIPTWLRKLVPFVDEEDWEEEELHQARYVKDTESVFANHYRYPSEDIYGD